MNALIRRLLHFSCRHSILIFIATALISVFFSFFAVQLEVDPNVESLIPESAEIKQLMARNRKEGISGEYLVLAVQRDDPFQIEALSALYKVLSSLEELPELKKGITPFNLMTFTKKGSRLSVVPAAPAQKAPATQEELELFKKRILNTPYARNLVVSGDGTVLNSIFPAASMDDFSALMERIEGIVSDLHDHYEYYLSGSIPFVHKTGQYLSRDLTRLFVFTALVILVFYFFGFRTIRGVVLPFAVVVLGTLWSLGFMSLLGFSLTIVNIITPPLVLTLGSSYSIHILNQYYRSGVGDWQDRYWVVGVVENVNKTILIAAATTIVGFLSLLATSIRQTREFALSAGFGIVSCALLSLFFFPALLTWLKPPKVEQIRRVSSGFVSRLMNVLSDFVARRRPFIIAALVIVAAAFGFSLTRINANTDTIGYFPQRDKVVQDMYFLTSKLGGFDEINLTLTAPDNRKGYFLQPQILQEVSDLEKELRSLPDISYSVSFASYLRFLNKVMTGADEIPQTRGPALLLSRYMKVLAAGQAENNEVTNLSNEEFSQMTLSFRIFNSSTKKFIDEEGLRNLLGEMKEVIDSSLPEEIMPEIWGMSMQYLTLSDLLRQNLAKSMLLSVFLVLGIASLTFRSLRFGFLTIIPLVSGVMLSFILMWIFGIPLDMTTIMVSAVAIGVGVDDAIHFLLYYRRSIERHSGNRELAVRETLAVTGRPILLTTLSIDFGLLVLALASFRPIVYFGILIVFTLSAACASTLVVLPALLSRAPINERKHYEKA